MPPRLAHKKSRKGCQRCKARKVKCDEVHPVCGNCAKHDVPCEYGDGFIAHQNLVDADGRLTASQSSPSSLNQGGSPSNTPSSIHGPDSPYDDLEALEQAFDAEQRRILEIRLLHHFVATVTYTFPVGNDKHFRDIWTVDAVRIALDHPFLLNAILAISSLHLVSEKGGGRFYSEDDDHAAVARITNPPDPALLFPNIDLAKAHRIYLNLAIRQQREAISILSAENADAIFFTSILLSYQALKLLAPPSDAYVPPTQWLSMSVAISTVVQAARPIIQEDSLIQVITKTHLEPEIVNAAFKFNPLNRLPFEAILDYNQYPEFDFDDKTAESYETAARFIGAECRAISEGVVSPRFLLRRIIAMGSFLSKEFVSFVAQKRPRALVILAYHFAVAKTVDDHWFFQGSPQREILGIQSILPLEWQWAMQWPLSMIRQGSEAHLEV